MMLKHGCKIVCSACRTRQLHWQPRMHQRRLGPWHRIPTDFTDTLPRSKEGFQYLLVIICSFSGWVEAFPTKDTRTWVAAKKFFNEVVCRYGTPEIIDSNNGGAFVGGIFTTVIQALGIKQKRHVPYRPQSSGQVKCMNRTIQEALRKVVNHTRKDWPDKLPLVLAAIHSSNRLRTKIQPFQILFGHPMRLMMDPSYLVQGQDENSNITRHDYFQWLKQVQEDKTVKG
ncbi:unnamed protein product [Lepidochelys kempii]